MSGDQLLVDVTSKRGVKVNFCGKNQNIVLKQPFGPRAASDLSDTTTRGHLGFVRCFSEQPQQCCDYHDHATLIYLLEVGLKC